MLTVLVVLSALGLRMAAYKLDMIRDVRFVGHADEAAYAEMGRALVAGRGFHVRHVSVFFVPYSPEIERREDHWPPFMGLAIAPAFRTWGVDSRIAKIPAILFGSLGLPLATALLAMAFSGRAWVGLLCGLAMMANLDVFTASMTTLSDVALAMLMAFLLAALLGARKRPWLHLPAGAVMALSYYAKGSMLALLPLYPAVALLACGPRVLKNKWLYYGVGIAGLGILPWLATNRIYYDDWFHSTQNFVSGYIGFGSWERNFYHPHWGKDLPQTSDRWNKHGERYGEVTRRNAEAFTRCALLGIRANEPEWYHFGRPGAWLHRQLAPSDSRVLRQREKLEQHETQWAPTSAWADPVSALAGLGSILFLFVLALLSPLFTGLFLLPRLARIGSRLVARWRRKSRQVTQDFTSSSSAVETAANTDMEAGAMALAPGAPRGSASALYFFRTVLGPALAIVLVMAVNWAFIVFLWEVRARFAFVFLPATAVLALSGLAFLGEAAATAVNRVAVGCSKRGGLVVSAIRSAWSHWRWLISFLFCLAVYIAIMRNTDELREYHREKVDTTRWPYRDRTIYPSLGDWLRLHQPDAVIMTRNPWQLRFHGPDTLRAVGLPYAPPQQILGIGWYYGITHYLDDRRRSGMGRYVGRRPHPAFEPVDNAPGNLYRIDWDRLVMGEDYVPPGFPQAVGDKGP